MRTGFVATRSVHDCPSQMNGPQLFGLVSAQAGERIRGPGHRYILIILRGLDRALSAIWAGPQSIFEPLLA
jgi:hypothetical protein